MYVSSIIFFCVELNNIDTQKVNIEFTMEVFSDQFPPSDIVSTSPSPPIMVLSVILIINQVKNIVGNPCSYPLKMREITVTYPTKKSTSKFH